MSVGPNNILVKLRTKGNITLAVTDKTDTVGGKAPQTGDRAPTNYRADKNGNAATRVEVLTASAKPSSAQAQAAQKTAASPAAKTMK